MSTSEEREGRDKSNFSPPPPRHNQDLDPATLGSEAETHKHKKKKKKKKKRTKKLEGCSDASAAPVPRAASLEGKTLPSSETAPASPEAWRKQDRQLPEDSAACQSARICEGSSQELCCPPAPDIGKRLRREHGGGLDPPLLRSSSLSSSCEQRVGNSLQ